jgi:electron transfer flavoprotein alpha subunit
MDRHVVVYGEIREGGLSPVTKELLGGARILADELNEELRLIFMGDAITDSAREALALGADKVYVVDDPKLHDYRTDPYASALASFVEREKPRILLFGNTDQGADLGVRLSFRLNTAIVTDCVEVSLDETKRLVRTKPVYGGVAMANYVSDDLPQMATIRPKSMLAPEKRAPQGEVIPLSFDLPSPRTAVLERVAAEIEGVKLEDADIIVSGGRGMGGPEGFQELEKAAKFLKGVVGGSRVACDNNWVPTTLQVGITGKIVAPALYLAVGISGASQHMSGCSRSKTIVAINKDSAAPIFKQAHYGVVGDWKVILPAFLDKLKSLE